MIKNILLSLAFVVSPMFVLTGCGGSATVVKAEATAKAAQPCAACAKGSAGRTTWCEQCARGFVDGKKMGCKACSKSNSGETASPCAACAKGKAGETIWCDKCARGFIDGKKVGCKACVKAKRARPRGVRSVGTGS